MRWSKYFIPTLKEVPAGTEAISHQLLLRAGLVHMLTAGVYSYLPLGLRVLSRVSRIIREEMSAAGALEVFLPCLHPLDLWQKTGRDQVLKDVMYRFKDARGREMCLGPTHEEVITEVTRNYVKSYRQLPVTLYQIQTKFRDELRPRFGIVRACEFIMKDAYSFDRDEAGLRENYERMFQAYRRIFQRCGLAMVESEADSGAMGGKVSHEFLYPAAVGEDWILQCPVCQWGKGSSAQDGQEEKCPQCGKGVLEKKPALELGHIFQLGTKYTVAQNALFLDEEGKQKPIIMGCYGIGVSRMIAAIIEGHHDNAGIVWPAEVSPFHAEILPLQMADAKVMESGEEFYRVLTARGFDVLLDDRDETAGRKFNDADLIGIPFRVVIGKKNLQEDKVELKMRSTGQVVIVRQKEAAEQLIKMISDHSSGLEKG